MTPLIVPVAVGVPASWPVDVLNEAHVGLFAMENVSAIAIRILRRRREAVGRSDTARSATASR